MNSINLSMSGPEYLAAYAMVAALVLMVCRACLHWGDSSRRLPPLGVSQAEVEPYEIAYMRSGLRGLAQAVTIGLIDRGVLALNSSSKAGTSLTGGGVAIAQSASAANVAALSPVELAVYEWFKTPRDARLFDGTVLGRQVSSFGLGYEESLQQKSLLRESSSQALVLMIGGGVLVVAALPRILCGLDHGRPVLFLMVLFLISLGLLGGHMVFNRLSSRGRQYLADLKAAERSLQATGRNRYALAVALWGSGALSGTIYAEVGTIFSARDDAGTGSGGCGGGGGCGGCGCG